MPQSQKDLQPLFSCFIGIDVSKDHLDLVCHGESKAYQFSNSKLGWKKLFSTFKTPLKNALVVLEATGGYEKGILSFLLEKSVKLHRADTRKVKFFIRSYGKFAKTDALDAAHLALYGFERHLSLPLFQLQHSDLTQLKDLVDRRDELTKMLVQEKNRLQSPSLSDTIKGSILAVISLFDDQLRSLSHQISVLISQNVQLSQKQTVITTIPGVGPIMSFALLAYLPELGLLSRRQIASLAGLAPHPKESGSRIGYRSTAYGGRHPIKSLIHMSALAASRSDSSLGQFYDHLIASGKKPMVALTALKRKIVVIANAKIRDSLLLTAST